MSWPVNTLVMVVRDSQDGLSWGSLKGKIGTIVEPLGRHLVTLADLREGFYFGYSVHIPGSDALLGVPPGIDCEEDRWVLAQWQLIKIGGPDVDTTEREDKPIEEHA